MGWSATRDSRPLRPRRQQCGGAAATGRRRRPHLQPRHRHRGSGRARTESCRRVAAAQDSFPFKGKARMEQDAVVAAVSRLHGIPSPSRGRQGWGWFSVSPPRGPPSNPPPPDPSPCGGRELNALPRVGICNLLFGKALLPSLHVACLLPPPPPPPVFQ